VCFAILIPIIYRVGRRESALADVICLGCAVVIGFCLCACWNAVKPKVEQPSEAAPTTETPTVAEAPKGETAKEKVSKIVSKVMPKAAVPTTPPSSPLDADWKEVGHIGNTFTVKTDPPQGGFWAVSITGDPAKPGAPSKLEGNTLTVEPTEKPQIVRFYKVLGDKAGKALKFEVENTSTSPPAPPPPKTN